MKNKIEERLILEKDDIQVVAIEDFNHPGKLISVRRIINGETVKELFAISPYFRPTSDDEAKLNHWFDWSDYTLDASTFVKIADGKIVIIIERRWWRRNRSWPDEPFGVFLRSRGITSKETIDTEKWESSLSKDSWFYFTAM